jgi:elongation factor Ts
MTEITASDVKALRDRTGAGMMDCKRALQEADGDEERAIDLLRQKGAAKAAKRAEREAEEGTIRIARADADAVVMVEVTSETDFVARNDEFVAFADRAARTALSPDVASGAPRDGEGLLDLPEDAPLRKDLNALRAKIGEKMVLRRFVKWAVPDDAVVGSYVHFGSKIGVLVELGGVTEPTEELERLARDVAMHVAATDPAGVRPEDIPEEERERERTVLEEQAESEGKPPEIVEKIVEGRMRKFFEENALLEQGFVKDPDTTVGELVDESAPEGVGVRRFVRFEIGG